MDEIQKHAGGRPLAFETVAALEVAVDAYFNNGGDAWMMGADGEAIFAPTMSGLAIALGVDRKTIYNYSNKDEYFPTIKKARAKVEAALERRLYGNNVTGVIFNLKNNFDWCDKNEIAHTSPDGSMTPRFTLNDFYGDTESES
jgi:hypothetical protein